MTKNPGETSYKDTAFGILPRSQLIPFEIEGLAKAWDFILKTKSEGDIRITSNYLKRVHLVGFGWIFPDFGGKFRTIEVTVSNHTPPAHYHVPQQIENFCKDISTRLNHLPDRNKPEYVVELIRLLAWAHHRLLWIHPFVDYNGRIARLLINMILLKLNQPPIELKVETKSGRRKYIQALQAFDQGDSTRLENIISAAIKESARELLKLETD